MDRKETIIKLRAQKFTYKEIGRKFNISRQRVQQILTGIKKKATQKHGILKKIHYKTKSPKVG